jgi:phytoene desaturase
LKKVAIIGAGFSGLSAAAYLAKNNFEVDVYEKNESAGGRARQIKTDNGYVFDMGPSWYWMPEVFEEFFNDFGYTASDFYGLKLLDPSFSIIFGNLDVMDVPADYRSLFQLFETIEKGSGEKLNQFLKEAEFKYKIGMRKLVYKPGKSLFEFADLDAIKGVFKLQLFNSFSRHIRKYFTDPKLISLLEFPVLFLGAMPKETPALYSLMNYAELKLGTWYPFGGFGKVVDAMKTVCENHGVRFHFSKNIERIGIENNKATYVFSDGKKMECDAVLATADYHHVENDLIEKGYRNYSENYWETRVMAPSCLIFYLGINKKIPLLQHHNLFFDEDLNQHAVEIYEEPKWPTKPLFYVCCSSKTDPSVAPPEHENIFILMPLAINLEDTEKKRMEYFDIIMDRVEKYCNEKIRENINYQKSYCIKDFVVDYNAFKGNAYGLANVLKQTAILKPRMQNKKVKNVFYAGQLTVPGPGVPPAIISGNVASRQIINSFNLKKHENIV